MSLIIELEKLRNNVNSEGFNTDIGICGQLFIPHEDWVLLNNIFTKWPKFSGVLSYPIPLSGTSPEAAYTTYSIRRWNMWDKTEEYGKLRHELLDFCISYLRQANT